MSFEVPADDYARFMGRYSTPLSRVFVEFAGVPGELPDGGRVLDVGSGPGALTEVLVELLGPARVAAIEPSSTFVEAVRRRLPDVDVRRASADELPHDDNWFAAALSQLVVHFLADPVTALREVARTVAPGGPVAACVWDFHEGGSPLSLFWEAVASVDPDAPGEAELPGTGPGDLADLFVRAGLEDVVDTKLAVQVTHGSFEEWWAPFELGVGPAGGYVAALDDAHRRVVRAACRERMGEEPFQITAAAWAARGRAT